MGIVISCILWTHILLRQTKSIQHRVKNGSQIISVALRLFVIHSSHGAGLNPLNMVCRTSTISAVLQLADRSLHENDCSDDDS